MLHVFGAVVEIAESSWVIAAVACELIVQVQTVTRCFIAELFAAIPAQFLRKTTMLIFTVQGLTKLKENLKMYV